MEQSITVYIELGERTMKALADMIQPRTTQAVSVKKSADEVSDSSIFADLGLRQNINVFRNACMNLGVSIRPNSSGSRHYIPSANADRVSREITRIYSLLKRQ